MNTDKIEKFKATLDINSLIDDNKVLAVSEKINFLIKKYGFKMKESEKSFLIKDYTLSLGLNEIANLVPSEIPPRTELIELSYILKTSLKTKNEIKIKSGNLNSSLLSKKNISDLILMIDSLIEYNQDGYYQYKFDWKFKEYISHSKFNLTEPYSDEETLKILELERAEYIDINDKKYNNGTASKANYIIKRMRKLEVFDNSCKTLRTIEACFIYDLLVVYGYFPEDVTANNQDKYQFIKKELRKLNKK